VDTGGVGLNLCAASHVIHFDRCYNPAKEKQATDRAHRMGQKKVVCVHKLSTKESYEVRLDRILKEKEILGDIVDNMDVNFVTKLSDEEILGLFSLRPDKQHVPRKGKKRKFVTEVAIPKVEQENSRKIANREFRVCTVCTLPPLAVARRSS